MDNKNNSGDHNSGDWNSGHCNPGDHNSGDWNSGHCNPGDWNSGDWNSGNCNSGGHNSGDRNSGHFNSGDCNSGHCNSGDHNSGDWNSGHFNTNSPDKIRLFNSWVDMSHKEFNEKYNICMDIPINKWVYKEDMTKEEKQEVSGWETVGGYLKTLDYKEACCIWWQENPDRHDDFLSLPNFDANIFKEITGIDVNVNNGVKYMVNEINKIRKEIKETAQSYE
jgi:hypothetical protein